jgi:hypothetical protein
MDAYGAGRLVGALVIAGIAGAVLWAGIQRRRRGENGTALIAVGAVLAIAFLVMIVQGGV